MLSGIPCVGVGKKLFHTDGLERSPEHREKVRVNTSVGKVSAGFARTGSPLLLSENHKCTLGLSLYMLSQECFILNQQSLGVA